MVKKLSLHILVFVLIFSLALTPKVLASASLAEQPTLSVTEKMYCAGELLTQVMDLILSDYVGGAVTPEELCEAALRGMADVLDPYSYYLNEEEMNGFFRLMSGQLVGIGVQIALNKEGKPEIVRVLSGTPAERAGLLKGDVIKTVNGASVDGLGTEEIVGIIADGGRERTAITVLRGSSTLSFEMRKEAIIAGTVFVDRFENALNAQIAVGASAYRVVQVTNVNETTAETLRAAIKTLQAQSVEGIVLDLRGNPGGYLHVAVDICRQLVPAGPIIHTVGNQGEKWTTYSSLRNTPIKKMVVLVDRGTASAAEIIAAALQDSGAAVVVGETTFGKGVIQTLFPLPTGGGFKLTTEEYFRRSGKQINKIGIKPDIVLKKPESYKNDCFDWELFKALEVLKEM